LPAPVNVSDICDYGSEHLAAIGFISDAQEVDDISSDTAQPCDGFGARMV
jgi:hypothetical protein